uniref:Uncharacterized protein n=1 Tax=Candidatus Kentrum sp. SD TaxID=2126332 RepID=A0A450YW08_9GAMM|nr:MAG: hypothetical protein BECKSD772F_GA0070984_12452 [Candidatus Kentron sp. SD]VFK49863.1 MAG: hypothetical protein BECKSD772E_GA0070983_12632 [Candidatus Kentron sp. SD]VFK81208.1 MAG: hypothetical protein BECKSD772D_GA0070982_12532 [Candidatus Kentron sp. SD]
MEYFPDARHRHKDRLDVIKPGFERLGRFIRRVFGRPAPAQEIEPLHFRQVAQPDYPIQNRSLLEEIEKQNQSSSDEELLSDVLSYARSTNRNIKEFKSSFNKGKIASAVSSLDPFFSRGKEGWNHPNVNTQLLRNLADRHRNIRYHWTPEQYRESFKQQGIVPQLDQMSKIAPNMEEGSDVDSQDSYDPADRPQKINSNNIRLWQNETAVSPEHSLYSRTWSLGDENLPKEQRLENFYENEAGEFVPKRSYYTKPKYSENAEMLDSLNRNPTLGAKFGGRKYGRNNPLLIKFHPNTQEIPDKRVGSTEGVYFQGKTYEGNPHFTNTPVPKNQILNFNTSRTLLDELSDLETASFK